MADQATPEVNSPATPAAGNAAAQPAAAASEASAASGRNWEKDYGELEARYRDTEAKAKRWETIGMEPEQTAQAIAWARETAAAIQRGDLTPKQAAAAVAAQAEDPYAKWDELSPREQAALIRGDVTRELSTSVRGETEQLRKQFDEWTKGQGLQLQLAVQSLRLAQENGVPYDELVQQATEMASWSPQKLLQEALSSKVAPAKMKQEIERQVNERVAAKVAEMENEAAANLFPAARAPAWLSRTPDKKNALEKREERQRNFVTNILRARKAS